MKCICKWHKPECDCNLGPAEGESDPFNMLGAAIGTIIVLVLVLIAVLFLSSRPAGASHGPTGMVVSNCCDGVNPKSGTSYRLVALAFQPYRYTSVFETGTEDFKYILQWPRLPSVAEQQIKIARERLSVVMALTRAERERSHIEVDWRHARNALGMALFFGGIMVVTAIWGARPKS